VREGEQNPQDSETSRRREEIRSETRSAMLNGILHMEPELEVKDTDARPKPLVTQRPKLAKDVKVGPASSHVNNGIGGDIFFEAVEDDHNHDPREKLTSGPSDDSSSDGAMSE
jgi:hypothetical protein